MTPSFSPIPANPTIKKQSHPEHNFDPAEVLLAMQPGMAWAQSECAGWPVDCCSDTTKAVYDDWWSAGASKGLRGLGRKYLWQMVTGWFIVDLEQEDVVCHVWLYEKRSSMIVDPTAGQFLPGPTAQIFPPDFPQAALYLTNKQYRLWRKTGQLSDPLRAGPALRPTRASSGE